MNDIWKEATEDDRQIFESFRDSFLEQKRREPENYLDLRENLIHYPPFGRKGKPRKYFSNGHEIKLLNSGNGLVLRYINYWSTQRHEVVVLDDSEKEIKRSMKKLYRKVRGGIRGILYI